MNQLRLPADLLKALDVDPPGGDTQLNHKTACEQITMLSEDITNHIDSLNVNDRRKAALRLYASALRAGVKGMP